VGFTTVDGDPSEVYTSHFIVKRRPETLLTQIGFAKRKKKKEKKRKEILKKGVRRQ